MPSKRSDLRLPAFSSIYDPFIMEPAESSSHHQLCTTSEDMTKIIQNLTARMEAELLTAVSNHCFVS